jgi:hypothetical protein
MLAGREGLRGALAGLGRGAAGALPAAVGGEDVAQAGQLVVVRGALLVVDHEEALGPLTAGLGDPTDRRPHLCLGGLAIATRPLGLMGEDAGGAPASSRLGRRRRPPPPYSDKQAAVRAAQRLLGPVIADIPLDQQVAMRAVTVVG